MFVAYPMNKLKLALHKTKLSALPTPIVLHISEHGVIEKFDSAGFSSTFGTQSSPPPEAGISACLNVYYIDELRKVSLLTLDGRRNGVPQSEDEGELEDVDATHFGRAKVVKLSWRTGRQSTLFMVPDAEELVEVVGSHLREYNRRKAAHVS
jgi:hypothetical protein